MRRVRPPSHGEIPFAALRMTAFSTAPETAGAPLVATPPFKPGMKLSCWPDPAGLVLMNLEAGRRPGYSEGRMTQTAAIDDQKTRNRESLLETLESIVIAFVLAFVFRAFIVEAFVIPTGSMGPTLYGAHVEITCCDCKCQFAVGTDGGMPTKALCPNCMLLQKITNPKPYSGDRILVLKYLYDFQLPQRWDVMVFHNPNNPAENYIKRLVALPGEQLDIVGGNVTIGGRMAHKPDKAQNALWMLVHDTRYAPRREGWVPRWTGDAPWQPRKDGFVFDPAPDNQTAWLAYQHWVPKDLRNVSYDEEEEAGRASGGYYLSNIRDVYGYDNGVLPNGSVDARMMGEYVCTDLGLRSSVTVRDRTSVVLVEMRAFKDRFLFELTAEGSQMPSRIWINNELAAQSAEGVLPVGRAVEIQAANVDQKIMLRVGGRRVLTAASAQWETTPEGDVTYLPRPLDREERWEFEDPRPPRPDRMAAEVKVGARGGPVELAWLRLDRDVYYQSAEHNSIALGQGEYFVCGDNSPKSFDSRRWLLDRPVVPERNIVGKAFFVYWPSAGSRWGIPVAPDPTGWRLVH
jgi:signal peptidase I